MDRDARQERCTRGDRHAGGLRARGQGDRRAADLALRGLRLVRDPRSRRVRGPRANPPRRVPRARVRRCRLHHARDALLATSLARGGCDGDRRLCDALFRRHQRLLRGGSDGSAPDLRPAGDAPGAELRDPGAPRRMGAGGRRRDLRSHAALAASRRADLSARRRRAARRCRLPGRRPARAGRRARAAPRERGRRSGPAFSPTQHRRPARPGRWRRSRRFPTSSTGSCPFSRRRRSCPALELACAEDAEAMAAAAGTSPPSAERLEGRRRTPRLRAARRGARRRCTRTRAATAGAAGRYPGGPGATGARRSVPDPRGDLRGAPAAAYGLLASGASVPELDHLDVAQTPGAVAALEPPSD